nr:PAS domain S-box protein [Rubrobacter sp.]
DLLPEEDRKPLKEHLVSLTPENPVGTFEHRVWRHDGEVRWQQWTNRAVFDEAGKLLGYQAVGRDYNLRKLAEEALKESEERFRSLAGASFEGICISEDGTVLEANLAFANMFGYEPSEVPGMGVLEFYVPGVREAAWRRMISESEGPWESTGLRKDGTTFDLEVRGKTASRGSRTVHVAALRDVTERRRVEKWLKESEEAHRRQARELSLLHQVRTVLARELDPAAVFRTVVEAVAETYGYVLVSAYLLEGEQLVLQHQVGYRSVLERIPVVRGVMGRVARTGEPAFLEDAHADPEFLDAIQGVVSEICVPLLDGGEVVGTLNVESTGGTMLAEEDLRLVEAVGEQASVALGRTRLHARLEEAEQRYRALIENVPAVVYIDGVDEANRALYRSPFVRDVLGYEPEEFLSDPLFWQSILHPYDRERVLAENARTNDSGEPFRIEYRMIRKDGEAIWIRDEAVLIRNEEGRPEFWQGYFVDITDRKLAEERLREAEERYRNIVEEVPAITYVHTQEPGTTSVTSYISPQIEAVLGYTPEEYSSDRNFWKTLLHPEDRERVLAEDVRTGETGEPFKLEFRMVRKDGEVVWLREEGRLVRRERGAEIWHGVMFDISEFKRVELFLRESEERYRRLVELSPEPIAVHDGNRLLVINLAGALLFGAASPEELLGREVLGFVHPDYREIVASRVRHTLSTGERSPLLEEKYLRLDGRVLD